MKSLSLKSTRLLITCLKEIELHSKWTMCFRSNGFGSARSNFRSNASAPGSGVSSPALSPRRMSTFGKLLGRSTFGSVYAATNQEAGALCAMKEVDLIPDDPKSAECMKQLEQVIT
ncbi:mitogen-activated protein kinase kinase kinase [Ranunculus cassubicifolius]